MHVCLDGKITTIGDIQNDDGEIMIGFSEMSQHKNPKRSAEMRQKKKKDYFHFVSPATLPQTNEAKLSL